MLLESDALEEVASIPRIVDYEHWTFQLACKVRQLIDHETADSLPPKIAGNKKIVDPDGIVRDLHRQDGDDVSDELAEESGGYGGPDNSLIYKESRDQVAIGTVDRANKKSLAFRKRLLPGCTISCSHSMRNRQIIS